MLIYIYEDQQEEASALQTCLEIVSAELFGGFITKVYSSGEALIRAVESGACPALVVLDIYMADMSGIETGRRLRALQPDLPLAFLTVSREFAVDAFELNALHYIVKPVTPDKVRALLQRLSPPPEQTARILELPYYGKTTRFPLNDISKIISKSRGVEIHLPGRSAAWLPCQFQRAAELLAGEPDFLLLSRGCMVNLNPVQGIDYDVCCLKNGEQLPVSRRERSAVLTRYNDFLFRKMDEQKERVP